MSDFLLSLGYGAKGLFFVYLAPYVIPYMQV